MPPLVLGSTGRIGRAFRHLWQAGHWPDVAEPVWHARAGTAPYLWDMRGPAPRAPACAGVIVLSGVTDPAAPADLNRRIAEAVLQAAGAQAWGPVLFLSTAAVYGRPTRPVDETAAPVQPGDYGLSKLAMEAAVAAAPPGPPRTCLRVANVAGCGQLFDNAAAGGDLVIDRFPDGQTPRRSHIGPLTLARALLELIAMATSGRPLPPVINIAQPGPIAMGDLMQAAGLPWRPRPAGPAAIPLVHLLTARADALIGPLPPATPAGLIAEARAAGWTRGAR
jgi:nucleoside-diphosphate-sugar epimerase